MNKSFSLIDSFVQCCLTNPINEEIDLVYINALTSKQILYMNKFSFTYTHWLVQCFWKKSSKC